MKRLCALAVLLGLAASDGVACRTRPLALGEALLVIDTDAAIPTHVSRLRVDVMRADGSLLDTREIIAGRPEDWPISFSVVADQEDMRTAIVRLRAYPEGHLVTRAEGAADAGPDPPVAVSLEDACANAPTLELGKPLAVKRGKDPITVTLPYADGDAGTRCADPSLAGSAVAKVVVTERASYRFEVTRSTPSPTDPGGSVTLSLRNDCLFPTSQFVCNDEHPAAIETTLDPGTYWVVTGGVEPGYADFSVVARKADQPIALPPIAPLPADAERLDPEVGTTIDRLVRLTLVQGYRGTVHVVLAGECFGTAADLAGARSCVDRAGVLVPLNDSVADGDLVATSPRPPPWTAEIPEPCTTAPRGGSALHDEEICVPGGAFIMGDLLALTDLDRRTRPERMRVVAPFLLDKFEFTVGRYRDAVAKGFKNDVHFTDGPLGVGNGNACTLSPQVRDRESFPLNCVTFAQARALCNLYGGDLPTEEQWEYAATAAGRPVETQYPWGDALPDCNRTAVERTTDLASHCKDAFGPVPVDDPVFSNKDTGDVSVLGHVGLGGNLQEWMQTGFYPYDHPIWQQAGLHGVISQEDSDAAPLRATRGGDWFQFALFATGSVRRAIAPLGQYFNVGFRCARVGK